MALPAVERERPSDDADPLVEKLRKDAELVSANVLRARPGEATILHLHPDIMHLTYTVRGKGVWSVGETMGHLRPGHVHIVLPNEPHTYAADREDPHHSYFVKVRIHGRMPLSLPRIIPTGNRRRRIEKLFADLEQLFIRVRTSASQLRETSLVFALFAEIVELAERGRLKSLSESPGIPAGDYADLLMELQTVPFAFPGIDELARRCHMSRRKFTDFFQQMTGKSPLQFMKAIRMSHAKKLLEDSDFTLKEIASQCGYANSQNLLRAYKGYYGENPRRGDSA